MIQEFIEFLSKQFIIAIYFAVLIFSIVSYKKYFDTVLRFFPILIAYTFFNELLGYFIRYTDTFAFFDEYTAANDIIYNIYALIFFGYFFWVYYRLNDNKHYKQIIKILSFFALIIFIVDGFFKNPLTISLYYGIAFASLVLFIAIILYFKNRSEWKWSLEKYNLVTWVSWGLALFYFIFPFLYLSGYLKPDLWETYQLRMVLKILIVAMYVLFCIGFIISRRRAFR